MAISYASTVREFLHRELIQTGYCDVVVVSEFEWKATRRLARAVGKTLGMRVLSQIRRTREPTGWPRVLTVWDPDMEVDLRELMKAALAHGALSDDPPSR